MRRLLRHSHPDGPAGADHSRRAADLGVALAPILFPIRGFLALGWARAATEKIVDEHWWNGATIRRYVHDQAELQLSFMDGLVDHVVMPSAEPIAWMIVGLQLAVAAALVTGRGLHAALWVAIVMNSVFVAMGSILPSCFYIVMQATLLAAMIRRPAAHSTWLSRRWRSVVALVVAIALLPFVETVHPAEVNSDPAIVLVAIAAVVATAEAIRPPAAAVDAHAI